MRSSAHLSVLEYETTWNAGANGQLVGPGGRFGGGRMNAAHVAYECASGPIMALITP